MNDTHLILIVDDEANFREIFQGKLSSMGYRVETAESGAEGVAKAKALKPDLILMDVKMPGMSGAEAVLSLREDPEMKNVKIFFLTSLGDPNLDIQDIDTKFSKDIGAQGYIKKTDDLDVIMKKVVAVFA